MPEQHSLHHSRDVHCYSAALFFFRHKVLDIGRHMKRYQICCINASEAAHLGCLFCFCAKATAKSSRIKDSSRLFKGDELSTGENRESCCLIKILLV